MATDLAVESKETPISLGTLERVVVGGDLSKLSSDQRLEWYTARCRAAGLDPVTQPFQYLTLQGKVTLYATKTATDQLTSIHKLSVEITSRQLIESIGVYEVTCRVTFPDGHSVEDLGALPVAGLKGEQASNALMKCYHPDTEILTENGWMKIESVTEGDYVAQYEPKTRHIFFATPKAVVRTETERWIEVSDNISKQVVTPNHDVLVGDQKIEAATLVGLEADVKRWRSSDQLPPVPVSGHVIIDEHDEGLSLKDCELRLLAAFLSDGSWTKSESQVSFGFHKLRKCERLRSLLDEADLPYSQFVYDVTHNDRFSTEYETRTVFYVKKPAAWLFGHYLTGEKALAMKSIINMTDRQARIFLEEMQFWDGCIDHAGGIIIQQSDQAVADSIQLLCVLHGIDLSVRRKESHSNLENAKPITRMRLSNAELRPGRRSRRSFRVFDAEEASTAYCVEVETGCVITRFDGQIAISGNCVTKAKRRTILSACGLGMLDETEIESIPGAVQVPADYVPRALSNDSGHGKGNYAPPAEVKSWEALLKILCERWNGRWHDHWFGEYGDWPAGIQADLVTQYRLVGRVIKVAKANGQIAVDGDGKHTQTLGVSALVWTRDKAGVEAQLESYLQQFFDLEKSKAEMKLNPAPAPEDDPDAEYADDEAILASEGGRQG